MIYKCPTCSKKYEYRHKLAEHMKGKHKDVLHVDPAIANPSNKRIKDSTALISYSCLKCGRMFSSQQFLDIHIKSKGHKQVYPIECFICLKLFSSKDELNAHILQSHPPTCHVAHQLPGTVSENIICRRMEFEHPFSMIVVGPSRSGKTHWVIDLLVNMERRIIPNPASITYCFTHWQEQYEYLEEKVPSVQFYEGLPSTTDFNSLFNAVVVFDDLMDVSLSNQNIMDMFIAKSRHQNISVILTMQNIFYQGVKSRSIQLNSQYMVLFKNEHDRHQLKKIAKQMYPQKWKNFMENFEHETSKPFGKVILALHPNTSEKQQLENNNSKVTEMFENHFDQQQRTLQYTNPNLAQARKVQENMKSILDDSALNDGEKASRYSNLMRDYQVYMLNAEKNLHAVPTPILPVVSSSHSLTVKKRDETPSSVQHFTHQSPFFTGYLPTPPDSSIHLAAQSSLPSSSSGEDSDTSDTLSTFVSFSDDEMTRKRKQNIAKRKYNLKRVKKKTKMIIM